MEKNKIIMDDFSQEIGVEGEQITYVAEAIFNPNQKNGKIKLSTKGSQSLGGLKYLIADLNGEHIASVIFEANQKDGVVKTEFGDKTYGQLLAIIHHAKTNKLNFYEHKKMANGGGVSNSLEEMMKNNDRIRTAVKMKFALAIGIDKAIKILDRDWAVSPYNLLISAVLKGFITIDDIDKNLSDEAIIEAEDVDSRYKDSGEGIGSSDMNAFIRSMLRSANVEERKMGTGGGIGNKFTYSIGGL